MKKILLLFLFLCSFISCTSAKEKAHSLKKEEPAKTSVANNVKNFKVENIENEELIYSKDIIKNEKPTLLVVITEWCPYCKKELPEISKFYSEYKDRVNVIVIYSNDRTTKERVKAFDITQSLPFKTYFDKDNEVYVNFEVKKYPSNYLIQKNTFIRLDNPITYEKLTDIFSKIK